MNNRIYLLLFLITFVLVSIVPAYSVTVEDASSDVTGVLKDAYKYCDITSILADGSGTELGIGIELANDPWEFFKENNDATIEIVLAIETPVAEDKTDKFAVSAIFSVGCPPEAMVLPEDSGVVLEAYETKKGVQLCIDILEPAQELTVSVSVEIDINGASCEDSSDFFKVPIKANGSYDTFPRSRKAVPLNRDPNSKLNKDNYNPPKGGYGWEDDQGAALLSLKAAKKALENGDKEKVWEEAEDAILNADNYQTRFEARDLIFKAGYVEPNELTTEEESRVQLRIGQERLRYYQELKPETKLGEIAQIKLYHKVSEEFGLPTSGLDDYEKLEREYLAKLLEQKFPEADAIFKKGGLSALEKEATKAEKAGNLEYAYRLLEECRIHMLGTDDAKDFDRISTWRKNVGQKILDSVLPADLQLLSEAEKHPAWDRIAVFPSRHFVFIIPKSVKERIKQDSLMRLDVAFTFEADFFGISMKKYSERVTVFLKELWGFSGGTGGGNQINIGFKWAVENSTPSSVDSMLYTHELGHCMTSSHFNFHFIGYIEGIADMAMIMSEDCLGRHASAKSEALGEVKLFEKYYLNLNVPYWRVQKYDPAFSMMTALLLTVPEKHGAFDWARMRGSLRDFKNFPRKPTSFFEYGWTWVKSLEPYFGEAVYDFYKKCRFPIEDESKALLQDGLDFYETELELAKSEGIDALMRLLERIKDENPRSYYRQLTMYQILKKAIKENDEELVEEMTREMGIINNAFVIGPYMAKNRYLDPLRPESDLGLHDKHTTSSRALTWEKETCSSEGFYSRSSEYTDYYRCYTLTYVNVPEETEVLVWARATNAYGIWLNNELVEKEPRYVREAWSSYTDYSFHKIKLRKGWNKVLGMVYFWSSGSIRLRITDVNGGPIKDIKMVAEDHENEIPKSFEIKQGNKLFEDDFSKSLSKKNWKLGSGKMKTKGGKLLSENGRARKFRFEVVPTEKRDPEPAIIWLSDKQTNKYDSYIFETNVCVSGSDSTLYLTLEGSGDEIITSGISIHLSFTWRGLSWSLVHYDTIYYSDVIEHGAGRGNYCLRMEKANNFYSLFIDGKKVFKNISLPQVKKGQIGIAFSEKSLEVEDFILYRVKEKK